MSQEALLYRKNPDNAVQCALCAHRCTITDGKRGRCNVRENRDGVLYSLVYGYPVSTAADPIEKKPLYHVLPGTGAYSMATAGCNFTCRFCQNWQISQVAADVDPTGYGPGIPPDRIVKQALASGCRSIAYTYTEPTVYFEYALDIARPAKEAGLVNIFVTNGFLTPEALETALPYLDAANVDLKSGRDDFYRNECGGRLEPVQENIRAMRAAGVWVEITTLLIPGFNDSDDELGGMAEFIAGVDRYMPWHISRYHPAFKFDDAPVTPSGSLERAVAAGKKAGLTYVYTGNTGEGSSTLCPGCGALLIERDVFEVLLNRVTDGKCPECGRRADGIYN